MVSLIIAAAGSGRRFGYEKNKVFYPLGNKPMIWHTVQRAAECSLVDEIVIVAGKNDIEEMKAIFAEFPLPVPIKITQGGKERQDSVYSAMKEVSPDADILLVHDGARPMADKNMFSELIEQVKEKEAVIYAVPVKDTIKQQDEQGLVRKTLCRDTLAAVQTPQGFKRTVLEAAYRYGKKENIYATDDASLAEAAGFPVHILLGSYANIKVTTKEDIKMAEQGLGIVPIPRVGLGYDVHRLGEGRRLVLGGVEIPFERGLVGHSDADVLVHAVMDALLGAAGLKDIGTYFPDTDERFRNISSISLLENVGRLLKENGYAIGNIDATLMAERPKIAPYIDKMKEHICQALEIAPSQLAIKATTTEKLGFVGKEEGMAAQAIASII